MQSGARLERLFAIIWRKPNGVRFVANYQCLPKIEYEKALGGIYSLEFAIRFGDDVQVGNSFKPFPYALPARGNLELVHGSFGHRLRRAAKLRVRRHAKKRGLHAAGRNFEWL